MVANGIYKSESTVIKHLSTLADAGLVTEGRPLAADFLSAEIGKFFTLPNEIFLPCILILPRCPLLFILRGAELHSREV